MANHPNRAGQWLPMPDELIDLHTCKAARLVKIMSHAASLGMSHGMTKQAAVKPGALIKALCPGGWSGMDEADILYEIYSNAWRIGKSRE